MELDMYRALNRIAGTLEEILKLLKRPYFRPAQRKIEEKSFLSSLSARARHCCESGNILSFERLLVLEDWELLKIRQLGRETLRELRKKQNLYFEEEKSVESANKKEGPNEQDRE